MATKQSVLGKGLASLLPPPAPPASAPAQATSTAGSKASAASKASTDAPADGASHTSAETPNKDRHLGISMAMLDQIHANQLQPRRSFDDAALDELAQSIKSSGLIQPLVVRKSTNRDGFELIAGERRLRAAKLAGLKQVPIVIRKSTDRESLELALIENIQRQNLNCVDEALAYFQLIQDFSLTQEEVAERVGKDRATVANYLRLLRLPEAVILDLKNQKLSFGHGKALLGLEDTDFRMRARAQILDKHLSVREAEALVDQMKKALTQFKDKSGEEPAVKTTLGERFDQISRDLQKHWSAKIEIKGNENRGKIVIHYSSRQELDRLVEDMQT